MVYVTLPTDKQFRLPFYLAMEEYVAREFPAQDYFFMWQVPPTVIFGRNQLVDSEVKQNYNNVIDTIRALREDAIVIVVSHDDRIIKKADQLILFNNKKMIQEELDSQVAPTLSQEPDNKENNTQ